MCDAVGGFSFLFKFSFLFGAHTVAHIMAQMHMISEQHSNSKNNKSSVFTLGEKIFSKRYLKLYQINNHFYNILIFTRLYITYSMWGVWITAQMQQDSGQPTEGSACLLRTEFVAFFEQKSYLPESVSENLY